MLWLLYFSADVWKFNIRDINIQDIFKDNCQDSINTQLVVFLSTFFYILFTPIMDNSDTVMDYFHYIPSATLAIMALVNFDFAAIYLATRIHMSKSPKFLYILPVLAFIESIGFLYRTMCMTSPSISKYVIMSMFLISPGNILTLVNYMALGKIIKLSNVQTDRFYLKPEFVTWFFFIIDIVFFWLQRISGSGTFGTVINIIGLSIHTMLFTCFLFIVFYIRESPDYNFLVKNQPNAKGKSIIVIVTTSVLLFIRSIFCVCLYVTGLDGPIASTEWAFYLFDVLIIAICFALHCVFFIGDYLPKQTSSRSQYIPVNRYDDLDEDDVDMLTDTNKHVAVFNNVQSVNYSIGSDS